jgi:hypothetical protein
VVASRAADAADRSRRVAAPLQRPVSAKHIELGTLAHALSAAPDPASHRTVLTPKDGHQAGDLVDTCARSSFGDTRRKARKYGAMGSTIRDTKPGVRTTRGPV